MYVYMCVYMCIHIYMCVCVCVYFCYLFMSQCENFQQAYKFRVPELNLPFQRVLAAHLTAVKWSDYSQRKHICSVQLSELWEFFFMLE